MYNILNFTIMFFQAINQMITTGTDLSINIRRVNNNLTVAVVPRRSGVKDGERIVPLILNGTPEELDAGFLQAVGTPVQKAQGILTNLETFEKQAEQAVSQSKAARSAAEKESKEVREKREKMEKLIKKADDAATARRFSEAMTWLKQARVLASAEKQKEIDVKMQEVQKQSSEGSLFGMAEEPVPVMSQPQVGMNGRSQPVMQQPEMFPEQHVHVTNPEPVMQTVHQQIPHETHQTAFVENGTYVQPAPNRPAMQGTGMPQGVAMQPYPQDFHQPEAVSYPPRQTQQPSNGHIQNGTVQVQNGNGREYQSVPAANETFCFDPEDENDRELLKEDPYAEYPDFPAEYRMKDEAQIEMVYC